MLTANLIDAIRLPFRKDKELYRSFYCIMGFYPRNIDYYREAIIHSSIQAHFDTGKPLNNERLEFLGDAVLDAVVGDLIFRHFNAKREGFLTNTRSKIVKRETLGRFAVELGLDKLLISNSHSTAHNNYLAGNAFEALRGAIYLDRGYDFCIKFVTNRIIGHLIDMDEVAQQEANFKSKLMEWCQKHKASILFEIVREERNETGSPIFYTKVYINGIEVGNGKGFSKKESHQQAAKDALTRFKKKNRIRETIIKNSNPTQ